MKKLIPAIALIACVSCLCACGKQPEPAPEPKEIGTTISGEFTVAVRDVIPDYVADDFTPRVAIVTEFQSRPFAIYVGDKIASQLQKDAVYVFSIEPTEVNYSVGDTKKMGLSILSCEGIRIKDARPAKENELGLAGLQLTYTEK